MQENNCEVGNDTLIEIKNTNVCDVPYIKILSNNKFWCVVCCKIGIMGTDNKKLYCNSKKTQKSV